MYEILQQLVDPEVRIPDNTAYRVGDHTLGMLYAYFVGKVSTENSPGLMRARSPDLAPSVLAEFKRRFQVETRQFFYERLGQITWRDATAVKLEAQFPVPLVYPTFSESTLEAQIVQLAQQGQLSQLGAGLREGAEIYHQRALQRGMPHYRFAAEYDEINRRLRK